MSTTKTLKVNQNFDRLLKCRANGYYDYVDVVIPTKDTKDINVEMQEYDGLKYTINTQGGKGTSIIDFSDTVLPWKFEMNNYLARTRYCWKPYREEPYQVEILKPEYNNISIVGTPTINDGIVSGFSSSNYLDIPYMVKSTNIEFYATIIPTYYSGVQDIYDANSGGWNIAIDDMKLRVWCLDGQIWGTTRLNEGVSYDIKVTIDDNWNTSIYYKESNSDDWILEISGVLDASYYLLNRALFMGIHQYNRTEPFLGSINLSGCYIKANGSKYNLSDAVYVKQWNLNKYGDIVISDDGIISNFSSSNYASVNNVYLDVNRSEEDDITIVFTTGDDIQTGQNILRAHLNNFEIGISQNNFTTYNHSELYPAVITSVNPNTKYWVKIRFLENKEYQIGISTNGSDYTWKSFTDTSLIYSDNVTFYIGVQPEWTQQYFRGTFDFANSSFPMDGGKLKTEELYGILDIDGDINIQKPLCYYVNKDQNIIIRQTKNITMDTSNWYLGKEDLYVDNMPHYNPLV